MANPLAVTLHASGAESSNGSSAGVDIGVLRSALKLTLEITAVAGTATPRLAVTIETSPTGAGSWQVVTAFEAQGNPGTTELVLAGCRRYVRARWTLTGTTPSFTFAVAGEAHQLLATVSECERTAIPTEALASATAQDKAAAALRATDEVYGAITNAYIPPITAWGEDVRGACADLYVWHALSRQGFDPDGPDALIVRRAEMARSWAVKVGNGQLAATGIVDSTPEVFEGGAYVVTAARRGW